MRRVVTGFAVLMLMGATLASMGCSGKTAATAAVDAASTAFDAVKESTAKVMPEETQKIADEIAGARTNITDGKFKEAMETAKTLPAEIKTLSDAATAKAGELKTTWDTMSAELPKAVESVQAKVDELSKSKKLPAGLDVPAFAAVKTSLEDMKKMWADAQASATSGDMSGAMSKVDSLKAALVSAMTTLGLEVPAALKPAA